MRESGKTGAAALVAISDRTPQDQHDDLASAAEALGRQLGLDAAGVESLELDLARLAGTLAEDSRLTAAERRVASAEVVEIPVSTGV